MRSSPVLLRKKAWSKLTPLRSLRFLIFENNIPSICCELKRGGEGKGGSYMTVSEWFAAGLWLAHLGAVPPARPCSRHSYPALTNLCGRLWGQGVVLQVREMQLWLLGNMNRCGLACGIWELELAITLQDWLLLQCLWHKEPRSDSTALLRLMLNEKLCHVQVTSFTPQCTLLLKVPPTILSAAEMELL